MSPISTRLEALAELHCVDPLDLLEFHTERSAIREHDEQISRDAADLAALRDVEDWLETRCARPHSNRGAR